jgi:uncharacterized RDD family membrane protein YckC
MHNVANPWRRLLAALIDLAILAMISNAVVLLLGAEVGVGSALDITSSGNILLMTLGIAYFSFLESSHWQATIGKKICGILVTDLNGNRLSISRAMGRYVAKFASAITLLMGFVMIAITSDRQGLHDMIAGTYVFTGRPSKGGTEVYS